MKTITLALAVAAGMTLCLQTACDPDGCGFGTSPHAKYYCDSPPGTGVTGSFSLKLADGTTWSTEAENIDAGASTVGRRNYVRVEGARYSSDWNITVRTAGDDQSRAMIRFDPSFSPKALGDYPATLLSCPKGDMYLSEDTYPQKQITCSSRNGSSVAVVSRALAIRVDSIDGASTRYGIADGDIHLVAVRSIGTGCYEHANCY
ncbi:hypothetical protein LVJ94_36220 [Pendulispora rubella]|uniref:Uncharacterized protein n=1 Tax=Pendulispora rubella TaxID=2741070 RepID=A0ABZ2KZC6_9BACT